MSELPKYAYNICMVHDAVTCLSSVHEYQKTGWETVSVFTNEKGILSILIRKPTDELEITSLPWAYREKRK